MNSIQADSQGFNECAIQIENNELLHDSLTFLLSDSMTVSRPTHLTRGWLAIEDSGMAISSRFTDWSGRKAHPLQPRTDVLPFSRKQDVRAQKASPIHFSVNGSKAIGSSTQ
jgi:hypothetical protein